MTEPPEIPRGVRNMIKALAPGWTYRVTPGRGSTVVRKNVDDPRENEGLKTAPTDVPVDSLALRCQHEDGRRAWAVWVRREDSITAEKPDGTWTFSGPACAFRPGGATWFGDITSRRPEVVTWRALMSKRVAAPAEPEQMELEITG